jgi:cation diffusion facilitator family transporter
MPTPHAAPSPPTPPADWPTKRRVTLVGAGVNVVLTAGKILGGLATQSQALIADGIHSLSDLLSDVLVLIAAHWGSAGADANHPYGHARIETAATALIGVLLLMVAGGFVADSITRLVNPEQLRIPTWPAIVIALISMLAKEALYHYTLRAARQTRSDLIAANAWHHRSDALSSLVVVLGVFGVLAGQHWLDAAAAVVVALFVGATGWQFIRQSFDELIDTGLPEVEREPLRQVIEAEAQVRAYHTLRTRRMGGRVIMDVRIELDGELPLHEAERIAKRLQAHLLAAMPDLSEVLVGVEAYVPEHRK